MPAMRAEEYVRALYRLVLGREVDPDGARHWSALLEGGGDPTAVLAGLLVSEEHRRRSPPPARVSDAAADAIAATLEGRAITIVDLGAQMLAGEAHIYEPLCAADIPHRIFGFEPLAERVQERQTVQGSGALTLLPFAVADGGLHTLHVNNQDSTSSLFPLNEVLCGAFVHLDMLRTVRTETILTRRLDDVLPPGPVDFLKLDVQGAELLALQGAERTLADTAVVHCEVEFAPLYRGQPLFQDVQSFLTARGFDFMDLLVTHRYAYRTPTGQCSGDRLIWADAVFFRQAERPGVVAAQAMIAERVYGKISLAEYLAGTLMGPG